MARSEERRFTRSGQGCRPSRAQFLPLNPSPLVPTATCSYATVMCRGSAVPIPTQSWRPCVPQPGYVEIRLRTVTDDKPLSRWWTKQWYAPGLCESTPQDYNKLVEVRNEVWPTVLP